MNKGVLNLVWHLALKKLYAVNLASLVPILCPIWPNLLFEEKRKIKFTEKKDLFEAIISELIWLVSLLFQVGVVNKKLT